MLLAVKIIRHGIETCCCTIVPAALCNDVNLRASGSQIHQTGGLSPLWCVICPVALCSCCTNSMNVSAYQVHVSS